MDAFQFTHARFYVAGRITSVFKRLTSACDGCSGALQVMLYKEYRFFLLWLCDAHFTGSGSVPKYAQMAS